MEAAMAYFAFFKVGQIKGEVTAPPYASWIELDSWSWGASRASNAVGVPEKLSIQSFSFTARVGGHSAKLLELLVSAEASPPPVKLAVTKIQTKNELPALQLAAEFTDVLLSVYDIGENSGDIPMEQVSFDFSQITLLTGKNLVVVPPPRPG
jgi:type VI protein secretion system component Hcp